MSHKRTINILAISMGAGGAEKTISLLLPYLVKDFNVNLILFHDIRYFTIPQEVNVFIISKNNRTTSLFTKIISPITYYFRYKKILRLTNPDISISFLTRPNLLNTFVRRKNTKVIISERCFPSIAYKSNNFRYKLYKFLIPKYYNKADVLFSNSKYINQDLKDNFGVKVPMNVIYNPVEIPKVNLELYSHQKDIDVIWVGKLYAIKNPALLIKAVSLCETNPFTCVLGEGVLLEDIKSQSEEIRIKFEGRVNNVFDFLKKSKILILTSNSEGFPNVILEGMSYGLPIISTNCQSGPLEILNDNESVEILQGEFVIVKYGILVNVNDEVALSKAIDYLLSNSELYNQLVQASKVRSQNYSVSKIYANFKMLIEK